ncbi:hypothetical protein SCWH03_24110 [Streptomyces pacificus]|uniref:Uncharacterized protein n=1 Tax=Streptomyces pacificus TaxID=2705029 RepID=A0A6A0AU47_9ACTN|nr:hypothetical protein SCWH03_24110 [Streptomyces pacificus]
MRAETRRSAGEVAALMRPWSQNAERPGTGDSPTGRRPDSSGREPLARSVDGATDGTWTGRGRDADGTWKGRGREPPRSYLFDARLPTTYTHLSLALTDHHRGCGRFGGNHIGS